MRTRTLALALVGLALAGTLVAAAPVKPPPPLSGYQQVTATYTLLGQTADFDYNPAFGVEATRTIECPAGKAPLSGGGKITTENWAPQYTERPGHGRGRQPTHRHRLERHLGGRAGRSAGWPQHRVHRPPDGGVRHRHLAATSTHTAPGEQAAAGGGGVCPGRSSPGRLEGGASNGAVVRFGPTAAMPSLNGMALTPRTVPTASPPPHRAADQPSGGTDSSGTGESRDRSSRARSRPAG